MGLFDGVSKFLESRLDDFLKMNPQLNLSFLEQEIKQQREDTKGLIAQLESQEKNLQGKVISLGKEVGLWNDRIAKAKQGGRDDLAIAAEKKQASLLQEGNATWQKMQEIKKQIQETKKLLLNLTEKQKEIQLKKQELNQSKNKSYGSNYESNSAKPKKDDLEKKFQQWELEQELRKMKENL